MGISTKKGDDGYTGTLSGKRVPKYDLIVETSGSLDEANSLIGLARASSKERRIRRILLQVQKHLFIIGAELSVPRGAGPPPKKTISSTEVEWLERLVDDFEEALALPPGFVAFGQEPGAAQMNVARTAIRKAERSAVRMHSANMVVNTYLLKYLNRLSDLVFVLACFEEKDPKGRSAIRRALSYSPLTNPPLRRLTLIFGSTLLAFVLIIVLILVFHRPAQAPSGTVVPGYLQQMRDMHN